MCRRRSRRRRRTLPHSSAGEDTASDTGFWQQMEKVILGFVLHNAVALQNGALQ
jgi:hypothetical protein